VCLCVCVSLGKDDSVHPLTSLCFPCVQSDSDSGQSQPVASQGPDPSPPVAQQPIRPPAKVSGSNGAMVGGDQGTGAQTVVKVVRRAGTTSEPPRTTGPSNTLPRAVGGGRPEKDDISAGLASLMGRGRTKEHRPRTRNQDRRDEPPQPEDAEPDGEPTKEKEEAGTTEATAAAAATASPDVMSEPTPPKSDPLTPPPTPPKSDPLTPPPPPPPATTSALGFLPSFKPDPLAPPSGFIPAPRPNPLSPPVGFIPAPRPTAQTPKANPLARPPGFVPVARSDPLAPPAGFIPRSFSVKKPVEVQQRVASVFPSNYPTKQNEACRVNSQTQLSVEYTNTRHDLEEFEFFISVIQHSGVPF